MQHLHPNNVAPRPRHLAETRYTTREVAEIIHMSRRYVSRLIENAELPAERHGRKYLVRESDLQAYIDHAFSAGQTGLTGQRQRSP